MADLSTVQQNALAQDSKLVSAINYLWERDTTLQDIVKVFGPFGESFMSSLIHRRFASLSTADREDMSKYLFHLWVESGSGEYALNALFDSVSVLNGLVRIVRLTGRRWQTLTARDPLLNHLDKIKAATWFIYGQWDWMDWRQIDAVLRRKEYPNFKKIVFLPNCGHQMCLENPDDFNRLIVDIGRE